MAILQSGKFRKNTKIIGKIEQIRRPRIVSPGGIHLVLTAATEMIATDRLKQILSWWFILQIVLPFTAPLQAMDLHDLMGPRHHHHAPASPESSTTPTICESAVSAFAMMLAPAALDASVSVLPVRVRPASGPFVSTFSLSPAPDIQHSILRL